MTVYTVILALCKYSLALSSIIALYKH